MGLKLVLDSLDGVDEATQKLYTKSEDGKFRLQVDDLEDTGALKRAKEHEKKARQEAEARAKKAEDDIAEMRRKAEEEQENGFKSKGDIEALEKSWTAKFEKLRQDHEAEKKVLTSSLNKLLVDNVATSLAAKISTAPDVILPHIKARLKPELTDGVAVTKVIGVDGSPSALTLDELADEFRSNSAFAPIIIGSKGSGGGGHGDGKEKGSKGVGDLPKTYSECKTPEQKAAWLRANEKVPAESTG